MKFRTEYIATPAELRLGPDCPLAMMGSCFSDYMGERLRDFLWNASNPCGVLFNPLSIARILELLIECHDGHALQSVSLRDRIAGTLFESGSLWHSWLVGSSFSGPDPEGVLAGISDALRSLDALLKAGRTLIVTFGTAWCYHLDGTDLVVANCHKQPAARFDRRYTEAGRIAAIWSGLLERLREVYDGLRVVFTVSPVRHVRDGFTENSLSKATLLLSVDRICRDTPDCFYFPAFEILTDDLRDYRFYASDLVHPSEQAVEYIREKFFDTYVGADDIKVLKEGESIRRRLSHRPLNPDSTEAHAFIDKSVSMYRAFINAHPNALHLDTLPFPRQVRHTT